MCSGPNINQCTGCLNGASVQSDGTCKCDILNQFLSPESKQCEYCDKTCQECTQTPTKCSVCVVDMFIMPLENKCYYQCPLGYFGSKTLFRECEKCHQSCQSCNGGQESDCLSCISIFFQMVQLADGTKKCVDCKNEENIKQYYQCKFIKILDVNLIKKESKEFQLEYDVNIEVTFDKIKKYKTLISSLKDDIKSVIKVSFAKKQQENQLFEELDFKPEVVNLDDASKATKIILRMNIPSTVSLGSALEIKVEPKNLEWINPSDSSDNLFFIEKTRL